MNDCGGPYGFAFLKEKAENQSQNKGNDNLREHGRYRKRCSTIPMDEIGRNMERGEKDARNEICPSSTHERGQAIQRKAAIDQLFNKADDEQLSQLPRQGKRGIHPPSAMREAHPAQDVEGADGESQPKGLPMEMESKELLWRKGTLLLLRYLRKEEGQHPDQPAQIGIKILVPGNRHAWQKAFRISPCIRQNRPKQHR